MSELNKIILNGTEYDISGNGSGITSDIKQSLLQLAQKMAYIDGNGQVYYNNLYDALYPPTDLVRISCIYTQSGTIYDTYPLDVLREDLTVTAHFSDGTVETVTIYTLSGTLTEGISTITVSYSNKITTFSVNVTENPLPSEYQMVEYLTATQTSNQNGGHINTGIAFNSPSTAKFRIDFEPSNARSSNSQYPIGTRQTDTGSSNTFGFVLSLSSDHSTGMGAWSGSPGVYVVPDEWYTRHNAEITWTPSSVSIQLDDKAIATESYETRGCSGYNIGIFGVPSVPTDSLPATSLFDGKIYSAQAEQDGNLLFNLVPCKRKSDNAVGVYDTVTQAFMGVSGQNISCITAGPEV